MAKPEPQDEFERFAQLAQHNHFAKREPEQDDPFAAPTAKPVIIVGAGKLPLHSIPCSIAHKCSDEVKDVNQDAAIRSETALSEAAVILGNLKQLLKAENLGQGGSTRLEGWKREMK